MKDSFTIFDSVDQLSGPLSRIGTEAGRLQGVSFWGIAKWFVVAGLLMYVVFAAVVVKQVTVMTESVDAEANGMVKLFSWLHFLGAIVITILIAVWL